MSSFDCRMTMASTLFVTRNSFYECGVFPDFFQNFVYIFWAGVLTMHADGAGKPGGAQGLQRGRPVHEALREQTPILFPHRWVAGCLGPAYVFGGNDFQILSHNIDG